MIRVSYLGPHFAYFHFRIQQKCDVEFGFEPLNQSSLTFLLFCIYCPYYPLLTMSRPTVYINSHSNFGNIYSLFNSSESVNAKALLYPLFTRFFYFSFRRVISSIYNCWRLCPRANHFINMF